MNFSTIMNLFPLIMKAVNVAQEINAASKSGTGVVDLLKTNGPEVLDLVTKAGAQLFPNIPAAEQTQAGVLRFDPALVAKIQGQLNKLGSSLAVDGDYGPRTKAAVTDFQRKHGLDADGWAGPITQAELNKQTGAA